MTDLQDNRYGMEKAGGTARLPAKGNSLSITHVKICVRLAALQSRQCVRRGKPNEHTFRFLKMKSKFPKNITLHALPVLP